MAQAGTPIVAAPARAGWRVAFAAALVAVPVLGVLADAPARHELLARVGLASQDSVAPLPAGTAPAAPDHALLDAGDVRRALPPDARPVAGFEASTL